MTAREKIAAEITGFDAQTTEACVWAMNKKWDEFTPEQRMVRSEILRHYERIAGDEALDTLMDKLEQAVGDSVQTG